MATSHYCDGKWQPGTVAACPKHTALSKKQGSVYRSPEADKGAGSGDAKSGSGDAKSGSGDAKSGSGDAKSGSGDAKSGSGDAKSGSAPPSGDA